MVYVWVVESKHVLYTAVWPRVYAPRKGAGFARSLYLGEIVTTAVASSC